MTDINMVLITSPTYIFWEWHTVLQYVTFELRMVISMSNMIPFIILNLCSSVLHYEFIWCCHWYQVSKTTPTGVTICWIEMITYRWICQIQYQNYTCNELSYVEDGNKTLKGPVPINFKLFVEFEILYCILRSLHG